MRFADIQGNKNVIEALRRVVDAGRVPHSILFHEDDGGGAFPVILAFLQYLYCSSRRDGDSCGECPSCNKIAKCIHPDVHFAFPVASASKSSSDTTVSPSLPYIRQWRDLILSNPWFYESEFNDALGMEQKSTVITVAEASSILSRLSLSSVEGGYRTVVIYLAEKMNVATANKLLKMIEEPPENTLFLLVTHSPERILPTIFSRCLYMRIVPPSREVSLQVHKDGKEEDKIFSEIFFDLMNALTARDLQAALEAMDAVVALPSREKQRAFVKFLSEGIRNLFILQQGIPGVESFTAQEREFYTQTAARCKRTFGRNALPVLDRSMLLLERNVSQKILFTDLACKLYRFV